MPKFTIQIIHRDGRTEPLTEHSGILTFATRDHAERMTHRLSFSADKGELYEVVELSK
jgi:hypothetical protein